MTHQSCRVVWLCNSDDIKILLRVDILKIIFEWAVFVIGICCGIFCLRLSCGLEILCDELHFKRS